MGILFIGGVKQPQGRTLVRRAITTETVPPPTPTDPHWANVVLLMHMDGANGSTSYLDQKGNTITVTGSTPQTTAQKKFGTSSADFTGTSDTRAINTDLLSGLSLQGDFTIEYWVNHVNATGTVLTIASNGTNTANPYVNSGLLMGYGTNATYLSLNGGGEAWTGSFSAPVGSVVLNTWQHHALTRQGNVYRLFVDGVQKGTLTRVGAFRNQPRRLWINNYGQGGGPGAGNFMLDELRVTNGVARYTADFTPPTAAFPNQ